MLAMTSHLPHILAFTFMNHILSSNTEKNVDALLNFAGGGFRDFTRIASSSPEMWRDICLANRRLLLQQIRIYQNQLACMNEILEDNDGAALEKFFLNAQVTRQKFLK